MPKKKIKSGRALLIVLALLGLLGGFAFRSAYLSNLKAVNPDTETNIRFDIDPGSSVEQIGKALFAKELISSPWTFKLYVKLNADETAFRAGSFVLRQSLGVAEIVEKLSSEQGEMWITILEGWRLAEVADYLAEKSHIEKGAFLDCAKNCEFEHEILSSLPEDQSLEGYLFPDTYIITPQTESYGVINRALNNLEAKFDEELRARAARQDRSVHEVLTMASLLEREVRSYKNRQIVAGILWKRLEAGMGLGVDASVLYALGDWKATLDYEALQIDSPYNTRKYASLPPGPICNPSLSSIKAALYPEESSYWFYLTTLDTGEVIYSKNLAEHNANVARYLR